MTNQPNSGTLVKVRPLEKRAIDGTGFTVSHNGEEIQTVVVDDSNRIRLLNGGWTIRTGLAVAIDLAEIDASIAGAKARYDHAEAQHNPDVLALIRAAEAMRAVFGPADTA